MNIKIKKIFNKQPIIFFSSFKLKNIIMSFYLTQSNVTNAALIVRLMGQRAMTLEQINTKLTANSAATVTETYLIQAARLGWLLRQPSSLWQVNLNMDVVNGQNRLISSLAPEVVSAVWKNEQPSSYVGGIGTVYSKALQENVKTGAISLNGTIVKPGTPVINNDLILAPNPRVV